MTGLCFPSWEVRRKDMLHIITHILSNYSKRHDIKHRLLPFLWSTCITSLGQLATLIVGSSGLVGIDRLMMTTQLFLTLQSRHTGLTITFSEWKRDYFGWLLFPKHQKKKNLFPLVSIFSSSSITHSISDLQKALCCCDFIIEWRKPVKYNKSVWFNWDENTTVKRILP